MNANTKQALEDLNFSGILRYARPVVRCCRSSSGPLHTCSGFCHDCEDKGLAPKGGSKSILMSHGCTSGDFVSIIGKQLPKVKCALPIMFLLENPGGDYGNGTDVPCDGVTKNPPNNHFYFAPSLTYWPTEPCGNIYGDYFAYLMCHFGLSNVYITNCVKCKYEDAFYSATLKNCRARFLKREIELFQPRIVFCFGHKSFAKLTLKLIRSRKRKILLTHPSEVGRGVPWKELVEENNRRIIMALDELSRGNSSM